MANPTDKFSAGAQGLGYIYQVRLALLRLLQLPENTAVSLEKDDDLDFVDSGGGKSLVSLKRMSGIHLAIPVFSKGYRPKQGKVAP